MPSSIEAIIETFYSSFIRKNSGYLVKGSSNKMRFSICSVSKFKEKSLDLVAKIIEVGALPYFVF
jgi:hypothetical protein